MVFIDEVKKMVEKDPIDIIKDQLSRVDALFGLHSEHELFKQWQNETKKILEEIFSSKSIHTQNFLALRFHEISVKGFSSPEIDKINLARFKKDLENAKNILQSAIKELTIDRTLFKKLQTKPTTVEVSLKGEYFISTGIRDPELTNAIVSVYEETGLHPTYGKEGHEKKDPITYKCDLIKKAKFCIYDLSAPDDKDTYLELGIAIGLGKKIIIIHEKDSSIPKWANLFKPIQYENHSMLIDKLKDIKL